MGGTLLGCQQGDERLKDKAKLEGETNAAEQIKAEKKYLEDRSKEMETDLARRQRFYTAVSGTYVGTMKGRGDDFFKVRLIFTASLPPYKSGSIRALDEIVSDLNNLYFNVQVLQWDDVPGTPGGVAFGCTFQNVRPDLVTGQMNLVGQDCASLYAVTLADTSQIPTAEGSHFDRDVSAKLANAILENQEGPIRSLKGVRHVTKGATIFPFGVDRVD